MAEKDRESTALSPIEEEGEWQGPLLYQCTEEEWKLVQAQWKEFFDALAKNHPISDEESRAVQEAVTRGLAGMGGR